MERDNNHPAIRPLSAWFPWTPNARLLWAFSEMAMQPAYNAFILRHSDLYAANQDELAQRNN